MFFKDLVSQKEIFQWKLYYSFFYSVQLQLYPRNMALNLWAYLKIYQRDLSRVPFVQLGEH